MRIVRARGGTGGGGRPGRPLGTGPDLIAALLVMGVAVALRNWAAALVAAAATVCLAAAVLPRAIGSETERVEGQETLTVLSANVFLGDADPEALIALVDRYRPDLLSVQELTPSFASRLRRAGIGSRLPSSVLMAQPKGHGAGLYSRYSLADERLGVADYGVDDLSGSDHRAIHARLVLGERRR